MDRHFIYIGEGSDVGARDFIEEALEFAEGESITLREPTPQELATAGIEGDAELYIMVVKN